MASPPLMRPTPFVCLTLLLAVLPLNDALEQTSTCRSNSTHISWLADEPTITSVTSPRTRRHRRAVSLGDDNVSDMGCWFQTRKEAEHDAMAYLRNNIMPFDVAKMETMGFVVDGEPDDDSDGLENGLVGPTVKLSIDAKILYPWADAVPKDVYYEYVLNYANMNEARTNWRPLITQAIAPMLKDLPQNSSVNDVMKALNSFVWTALVPGRDAIVFKASQTPLIFDPMSVIAFGYASCTGMSVLFVNALRAAGIPARVAGTPAWQGNRTKGNHNWVEVYWENKWAFMEPAPSGGPDDLNRNPCERWFCNNGSNYGTPTKVFAARLDQKRADTFYRMAWEWNNTDVPGVDRTEYYKATCSRCNSRKAVCSNGTENDRGRS